MYQEFTAVGTGSAYRDFAEKLVQLLTSSTFATLAVSSGGSGYLTGDILKITDASGLFECTFEVLANPSKVVTGVRRLISTGAFSNRFATVTISAAGAGYAANDVVQIVGGGAVYTEPARVKILTVDGSGHVLTCQLIDGGGSYSTFPSSPAPTDNSAGTGTGTGLTLTFTTIPILNPAAPVSSTAVTGVGTGATFVGTLGTPAWTVLRAGINYVFNGTNEYQMILQGSTLAGQQPSIMGIRTGKTTSGTITNFVLLTMMSAYNSLSTFDAQPDIYAAAPVHGAGGAFITFIASGTGSASISCFLRSNGRQVAGAVKNAGGTTTAYHGFYVGLANPNGSALEFPWPAVILASTNDWDLVVGDSASQFAVSGPSEVFRDSWSTSGPCVAWSAGAIAWVEVFNASASSGGTTFTATPPFTVNNARGMFPAFDAQNETTVTNADLVVDDGGWAFAKKVFKADGNYTGGTFLALKPTPNAAGDVQNIWPLEVVLATEGYIVGALDGCYAVSGVKSDGTLISPEDTFQVGQTYFKAFPNGSRVQAGSFWALQMGI